MQADVLLGFLHNDLVTPRRLPFAKSLIVAKQAELEHRTLKPTPTRAHFFQQGHTYSKKDTLSNNVTPYGSNIETDEPSYSKPASIVPVTQRIYFNGAGLLFIMED